LPIRVELDSLTASDFRRILCEPKDALITQYQALMATEGVTLEVHDDAVAAIADTAYELNQTTENIGGRRLTTVMERLMEDISFNADQRRNQTVVIDKAYVDMRLHDIVEDPDLSRYIL
jgi:ATP-dependent HslUV protease ATP-binding subunit HslU